MAQKDSHRGNTGADSKKTFGSRPVSGNLRLPSPPFGPADPPTRLLRLPQVLERTGLGKTKIYEMQNLQQFPMSVKVTETSVRWVEAEVQTWLDERSRDRGHRDVGRRRHVRTQQELPD